MFAVLGWFYLSVLPGWLGMKPDRHRHFDVADRQVGADLPRHPAGGRLSDPTLRRKSQGQNMVRVDVPAQDRAVALYGLLFTIVILFALQGEQITSRHWDVVRIALPLLAYFAIMWDQWLPGRWRAEAGLSAHHHLAFTSAGNNFELAIAVAIATFGRHPVRRWPAWSDP